MAAKESALAMPYSTLASPTVWSTINTRGPSLKNEAGSRSGARLYLLRPSETMRWRACAYGAPTPASTFLSEARSVSSADGWPEA
ncbi:hypothetical protein G6F59_018432 [Rhizopus arrhizus]|nr:hypothetical protein G6F59_018432 [Rhizopus arrhizus]